MSMAASLGTDQGRYQNAFPRCMRHACVRKRVGPTGGKEWMLLADVCRECGVIRPVRVTDYSQRSWVRRWNNGIKAPKSPPSAPYQGCDNCKHHATPLALYPCNQCNVLFQSLDGQSRTINHWEQRVPKSNLIYAKPEKHTD